MTVLVQHRRQAVLDVQESEWKGCTSMAADESKNSGVQAQTPLETAGLHPSVHAAKEWFDSPRGRARSRYLVNSSRYPISAESLRDEALALIWTAVKSNPEIEILNTESYCQTVMRNLCRAWQRQKVMVDLQKLLDLQADFGDGNDDGAQEFPEVGDDSFSDLDFEDMEKVRSLRDESSAELSRDMAVAYRARVELSHAVPSIKASVLNFLTLCVYPEIDCSDLPQPQRGSNKRQARWWSAIALATRDSSLFPGVDGSTGAQRQAFSRLMNRCEQIIVDVRVAHSGKELVNG